MRNKSTQGFTLIELLIVIAIIGILAAVLIPNLLGARNAAQDRAVQAFGSQVYTAGNAYLAENTNAVDVPDTCTAAGGYTAGNYSVDGPGPVLSSCTITNGAGANFTVEVASTNGASFTFGN